MALFLDIKVVTQSGKKALMLDKSGMLKCFVKAAPQDGKANKEVIEVIADLLRVPKKSVEIVAGLTSRQKRIAVDTQMTREQFLEKIGAGIQGKIFHSTFHYE